MSNIPTSMLLRIGSVAVAIATTAAAVGGWLALDVVEAGLTLAPNVSAAAGPSQDLLAVVDESLTEVRSTLDIVASASDQVSDSTEDVAAVVESTADLASGRLPNALEALEDAMPALIDTAAIVDNTLRALGRIGVDYDPEVPFDEALRSVQAELDGLPEIVAEQGDQLAALVPRIESTGDDTAQVSSQIAAIDENLGEAQATIEDYRTTLEGMEGFTEVGARISSSLPAARLALGVLAGAGLVLALMGWMVANRLAVPSGQPDRAVETVASEPENR